MKLRYKKMILVITTFTMMIGMSILSTIAPAGGSASESEKLNKTEAMAVADACVELAEIRAELLLKRLYKLVSLSGGYFV